MNARFSLRSLLIITALLAVSLGWWIDSSRLRARNSGLLTRLETLNTLNDGYQNQVNALSTAERAFFQSALNARPAKIQKPLNSHDLKMIVRFHIAETRNHIDQALSPNNPQPTDHRISAMENSILELKDLLDYIEVHPEFTQKQNSQILKKLSEYETIAKEFEK